MILASALVGCSTEYLIFYHPLLIAHHEQRGTFRRSVLQKLGKCQETPEKSELEKMNENKK